MNKPVEGGLCILAISDLHLLHSDVPEAWVTSAWAHAGFANAAANTPIRKMLRGRDGAIGALFIPTLAIVDIKC